MRIAEIHLRDWMRFRGEHALKLDAKSYAVVARSTENADRSNWLGKSSLLEAIDFALWGRHRFRTEDEWISRGEPIGEVKLVLDTGSTITRRRERGKRTTLLFTGAEARAGAMQDEAQAIVAEVVGLGAEDFLATCYFQQRQMARMVLADPGERMAVVSGWLRLGPLERCDEKVRAEVSTLAAQLGQIDGQLAGLVELERHTLDGQTEEQIREELAGAAEKVEAARGRLATAQNAVSANAARLTARQRIEEFEALVRDGKALAEQVDEDAEEGLRRAYEKAREAETAAGVTAKVARAEQDRKRDLSRGEFDGKCPVAGIECPATEDINRDRRRGLKLYDEAREACAAAEGAYMRAREAEQKARAEFQEHGRLVSRLASMRAQAERLEPGYEAALKAEAPEDAEVLRLRQDEASRRLNEATERLATLEARLTQLGSIAKRRETLERSAAEYRARVALYREASVIFGKQGAQRRVAEGGLLEIETGANAMLTEAGMDLSVSVRWSREGSGLARSCPACGYPFPSSARVKVCQRCQAARGPNLINKLEFAMSDRSGAAEDLAGIALQLSASAWLRAERGSLWETALLDEPYGQLDPHHRKSLGRHLAALLAGRYGFSQAFVVAHSADVLEALPGRIQIEGGPEGSSVRVLA